MAAISNTLATLMDKILTRGLSHLRGQLLMPGLSNADFSSDAAKKGDVINIQLPTTRSAKAVAPNTTPPDAEAHVGEDVQIQLDQWYHADFGMTDKDEKEIDAGSHFMPANMEAAFDALAENVNAYLYGFVSGFSNQVPLQTTNVIATQEGFTAGAPDNPFGTDMNIMAEVLRIFTERKVPLNNRRIVLTPLAHGQVVIQPQFSQVEQAPDAYTRVTGLIGRNYGMEWYVDQQVPSFTPGTGVSGGGGATDSIAAVVNGAVAAETPAAQSRTIPYNASGLSNHSGTIKAGDVIHFGTDFINQYNVVAGSADVTSPGNITIYPGLRTALSGGEEIVIDASNADEHKLMPIFHREAIAFANRPLAATLRDQDAGRILRSMRDPVSGITLRLELLTQYKQTAWDVDILYGGQVVRRDMGIRLIGN